MKLIRWIKAHWLISLILAFVLAGVAYQVAKPEPKPEIITEIVARGDLMQTVDVSGEVESKDKIELAFETSGLISGVFVRKGDEVAAGQILATIDTQDLFSDPFYATETVKRAQATLDKLSDTSGPSAIATANSSVYAAEVVYKNTETELERAKSLRDSSIAEAQTSLTKAEHDMEQASLTQADDEEQIREDFAGILQGNVIAARSALATADEILGVTNTLVNDDFESILALTDSQILRDAEKHYTDALGFLQSTETTVFKLTQNSSYADINVAVSMTANLLSETAASLLYTHRALDATIVDSQAFSFDDLATKRAEVDTMRDLIRAEQDTLETQTQLVKATGLSNTQTLIAKGDAVVAAKQALARVLSQQDSSVASAESIFASSRASLEQKIASAYETIGTTQGTLRASEISSPIAGIITEVNIETGEYATIGKTVMKVENAIGGFEIKVDVPESDIAKIKSDQPAAVEFDAYGSGLSVPAQVCFINPAEKVVEGVVFYEVTLFFTAPENLPLIKPGMTVDVTILTNEIRDVLSIPQRAVFTKNDYTYTRVRTSDIISEVPITTGMRGDGGRVEVLEGLSEGNEVVITIKN